MFCLVLKLQLTFLGVEFAATFTETFMEFGVNKVGRNTNADRVVAVVHGTYSKIL